MRRDLIVVGGSAGSLAPLVTVLGALPNSFEACILVVIHSSSDSPSRLAQVLERASRLPVSRAADGDAIQPGVFVAPPDHHLIVTPASIRVTVGPKENGFRPAIDPLFRTAARAFGSRVIGVVLSGGLDDGVYGLNEIKRQGGLVVVQDPDDAEISSLPRKAIEHVDVDYILTAAAIAPRLTRETKPSLLIRKSRDAPGSTR